LRPPAPPETTLPTIFGQTHTISTDLDHFPRSVEKDWRLGKRWTGFEIGRCEIFGSEKWN
jgi:hypothetical protein